MLPIKDQTAHQAVFVANACAAFVGRLMCGLFLVIGLSLPLLAQQKAVGSAKRVTDRAALFSAQQSATLIKQLSALEASTGAQVAVLTLKTTQPETIEQFSLRVAESWKLGRGTQDGKRIDDGVLIVVASTDRKMRIEVGYGLEGAIPDALAKRIIEEQMKPRFRANQFFDGVSMAVASVGKLIRGESLPPPKRRVKRGNGSDQFVSALLFGFIAGSFAMPFLGQILGMVLTAAVAVGVSVYVGASAWSAIFAVIISVIVVRLMDHSNERDKNGKIIRGRRGRRSGGGGGGYSGGSGGGFSGGGGGFGGGGASGSW